MRELLDICQQVIHSRNPFVRDFKQILEIPEDNLEGAKVVICASARPQHGHERVYNAQINLQELSIVKKKVCIEPILMIIISMSIKCIS